MNDPIIVSSPHPSSPVATVKVSGLEIPVWFLMKGVFSCLVLIHFLKVMFWLPFPPLLENKLLLAGNYAQSYAAVMAARDFCLDSGVSWGYSAHEMAGHAAVLFETEARPLVWADRFLWWWLPVPISVRLTIMLSYFMVPFLFIGAARAFRFDERTQLVAMALSVAGFGNFDFQSQGRVLNGFAGVCVAMPLAVLAVAAFYRALHANKLFWWMVSAAALWASLLFHPWAFFMACVMQLVVVAVVRPGVKVIWGLLALALWIVSVVGNWNWLAPALRNQSVLISNVVTPLGSGIFLFFHSGDVAVLCARWLVMASFFVGVWKLYSLSGKKAALFLVWCVALILMTQVPLHWPLLAYSPVLWLVGLTSVLVLPAAFAFSIFCLRSHAIRVGFFLIGMWGALTMPLALFNERPLRSERTPLESQLVSSVQRLAGTGRILVENTRQSNLSLNLLPLWTKREFLGTHSNSIVVQALDTNFLSKTSTRAGFLFGRPLSSYTESALRDAMERSHVEYVVAFSLSARSRFDRFPHLFQLVPLSNVSPQEKNRDFDWRSLIDQQDLPSVEPFRIYRFIGARITPFLQGSGELLVHKGRFEIRNASSGSLVLKYHWLPSLRATAGVAITPVAIPGDRAAFIGLTVPPGISVVNVWNDPDA